ncbi:helix-turn-helix domain-containing protein [Brumimicrobium oceani]|uniref:HTH cro/C1-type domain-containing protein n=1 Tax=Brumimicrobium oceani TaxID=2100725 RepID=A0A2U2X3A0_9FLAO|nr:hypothetical protein [Brumimicrobium oceani]PWH82239.1 hypothetical protein DIT68_14135 [Brumimicrobium oceani]
MKTKQEKHNSSQIDEILQSTSPIEEKRIRTKMLLAAKIEDAMKAKGWNRKKLLEATGQKNASVATKWFSGTHNFTHDTLFDIQEALGIELINLDEQDFYKSFGAFGSEKSAEEISREIKESRRFRKKDLKI